jgi:hypothetical protein
MRTIDFGLSPGTGKNCYYFSLKYLAAINNADMVSTGSMSSDRHILSLNPPKCGPL